ncbi:MAG: carboxypeptidase regulatory-like domain-containing protein [Planctomycetota bacterium]
MASPSQVSPAKPESDAPRPKQPAGPRGAIDPSQTGTISGVVRFDGKPPERRPLAIGGTGGCPDHPTPVFEEAAIVNDGKLANVFLWIKDGLEGWDLPPAGTESRMMDQRGCLYVPHVLGMRAGETLLINNSDAMTTHNVNIRSRSNDAMNPVQPPNGQPIEWRPKKKELGVAFECNLHPWMRAFVCVVEHPWFAVSGEDGTFVLQGVPPGDYVVEGWHEKFGKRTAKVTLTAGGSAEVALTFDGR